MPDLWDTNPDNVFKAAGEQPARPPHDLAAEPVSRGAGRSARTGGPGPGRQPTGRPG
jgi:hypothetical protein